MRSTTPGPWPDARGVRRRLVPRDLVGRAYDLRSARADRRQRAGLTASSLVYDINDRGDVAGFAVRASDGQLRALLMLNGAVPEPGTYASRLADLLLVGRFAHRTKEP